MTQVAAERSERQAAVTEGLARRPVTRLDLPGLVLAMLSGGLVALGWAIGWRGVDLPAQAYRVQQFRSHGFTLWDSQWYSGHWTLDYSVLYPPLAAAIGMGLLAVVSAVVATAAFDRILVGHLGPPARLGSAVFAVSVIVETSIGQLSFFTGEAFGLGCLWVLVGRGPGGRRRRWIGAAVLALAATLTSPLAGAFVALALAAWCLTELSATFRRPATRNPPPVVEIETPQVVDPGASRRPEGEAWRLALVCIVALVPIGVTALLFPGQGPMPYPAIDWLWETVVAVVVWAAAPRRARVLRLGIGCYLLVLLGSVLVPSALGGNVGRMEDAFALPLVAACAWQARGATRRPVTADRRPATADRRPAATPRSAATHRATRVRPWTLGLLAVPLALSQWSPAWQALTSNAAQPWTKAAYYTPVTSWLSQALDRGAAPGVNGVPDARVEVVPTADHWEAAYVARHVPLARGWERQLDEADNPLFYGQAPLTPASYRAWLKTNGARYVALASAPLDSAGVAEAALVEAGVPGLREVWRDARWRVYEVVGGPGIVSGRARLTGISGDQVDLDVTGAGTVLVRVRWAAHWHVASGAAHLVAGHDGWTTLIAAVSGRVVLDVGL